jgi:hypothetical protein
MSAIYKKLAPKWLAAHLLFLFMLHPAAAQFTPPAPVPAEGQRASILRLSFQNGYILRNRTPFLSTPNELGQVFQYAQSFSLEYGWQTSGNEEWHQVCKYPRFGIGTQYLYFLSRDELGAPFSLYGFYDGNYYWSKNFQVTSRLGAGLAYGFKPWSAQNPLSGDLFSTRLNAFTELGLGVALRIKHHFLLEPGFRFQHFSNGNLRKPQRGINITAYSLALRSELTNPLLHPEKMPLSQFKRRQELLAFLGISSSQLEFKSPSATQHLTYGMNFLMANLHLGYNYQISRRLKLGTGIDLVYDGTNGMREAGIDGKPARNEVALADKAGLAVFIGGESVIDRLSIVTTLGYIVARTHFESSSPAFEQRLGFKYHYLENAFAGVNIRAYNFRAAKAIEFNLGFRKFLD